MQSLKVSLNQQLNNKLKINYFCKKKKCINEKKKKRQSLKVSLNLQLNNQKHNQNNICKKINLKVIKPAAQQGFGDMLTFYSFIFKFGAVRHVDVCVHIHKERESVTHTHMVSLRTTL